MAGADPRYDAIAEFYSATMGDAVDDPGTAALLELAGEVRDLRVLDLACGHGRVARELARRGASVVGVDVSEALLRKARAADGPEAKVRYVRADVTKAAALAGEAFDGVVCNFGLSDIDDLDGAVATVARVLPEGGWFVFSLLHPCFPGWDPDAPSSWSPSGYYQEGWWLAGNTGFRGRVGSTHRMLSTYVNTCTRNGLTVERIVEPEPGRRWSARLPGAAPVPVYLVVRGGSDRPGRARRPSDIL